MKKRRKKRRILIPIILILLCIIGVWWVLNDKGESISGTTIKSSTDAQTTEELAALQYDGDIVVEVNDNVPTFSDEEKANAALNVYEEYSPLDEAGRCGVARAVICTEIQPAEGEKRESLGEVTPSGWQKINFWNRCHLIGWQLSGENANERNLITGTGWMNVEGMLPYENMVDDYLEDYPYNHVLYEVEPVYSEYAMVASGVHMQAWSVEDDGRGVAFNIYAFNYQPGYIINYERGTVLDDPEHQTTIKLTDRVADETGYPQWIGDAKVTGSKGKVRYLYYRDADCKERTTPEDGANYVGGAPANAGIYYARAVVAGDNWYPTAASNTAKLTIK